MKEPEGQIGLGISFCGPYHRPQSLRSRWAR